MTFSTRAGWEAQRKETRMMGVILVRCPDCGQLSYDPRTGKCEHENT